MTIKFNLLKNDFWLNIKNYKMLKIQIQSYVLLIEWMLQISWNHERNYLIFSILLNKNYRHLHIFFKKMITLFD